MDEKQGNYLLGKAVDHSEFVNAIVRKLCDISYYLNQIPLLPTQLKGNQESLHHYQSRFQNLIQDDLKHLKQEEPKGYIDSHGNLFTLFNHLEKRVESEVLNNIKSSKS